MVASKNLTIVRRQKWRELLTGATLIPTLRPEKSQDNYEYVSGVSADANGRQSYWSACYPCLQGAPAIP